MSQKQFHIDKAQRNEQFFLSHGLEASPFNEWAVIVLFYVAMHYVDAVLSQDQQLQPNLRDPRNHSERNEGVAKCASLSPLFAVYGNLYDRSRDARYNKMKFPDHYLSNLKTFCYDPIRKHVRTVLALQP